MRWGHDDVLVELVGLVEGGCSLLLRLEELLLGEVKMAAGEILQKFCEGSSESCSC